MSTALPDLDESLDLRTDFSMWQTVVWDDPVNLMSYVVHVFREYFGFSTERATTLMLQVHNDGRAIVADGAKEHMERHVAAMHSYGLTSTLRRVSS